MMTMVQYENPKFQDNRKVVKLYTKDGRILTGYPWGKIPDDIVIHRKGGPAVEFEDGEKQWWEDGKLHRKDGPAVDFKYAKKWFLRGYLHRADGPAVEYADGTKEWWFNGKLHREDGPAIEVPGGRDEYWLFGRWYTIKDFNQIMKDRRFHFKLKK